MRRSASVLTFSLGLILIGYDGLRLGIDGGTVRNAEADVARFGEWEKTIADADAILAAEGGPLQADSSTLSNENQDRAASRLALADRLRQVAQSRLGDHSSREAARILRESNERESQDDCVVGVALALLVAGFSLAPRRQRLRWRWEKRIVPD